VTSSIYEDLSQKTNPEIIIVLRMQRQF